MQPAPTEQRSARGRGTAPASGDRADSHGHAHRRIPDRGVHGEPEDWRYRGGGCGGHGSRMGLLGPHLGVPLRTRRCRQSMRREGSRCGRRPRCPGPRLGRRRDGGRGRRRLGRRLPELDLDEGGSARGTRGQAKELVPQTGVQCERQRRGNEIGARPALVRRRLAEGRSRARIFARRGSSRGRRRAPRRRQRRSLSAAMVAWRSGARATRPGTRLRTARRRSAVH